MLNQKNRLAIAVLSVFAAAGAANAGVTATITADNHYALYTGNSFSDISFIGRNELGSAGSPGTYNWSKAETWNFNPGAYIYVAVWSDDAVAQGWLGQFAFDAGSGGQTLLSSSLDWEYVPTNINLGDGDPAPSVVDIGSWVNLADTNLLWDTPFVGGSNGVSPWGTIAGVSSSAKWTWGNPSNRSNPLIGGDDFEEYQIFRIPTGVPAPGGAMLALAGIGMIAIRRR
ncbi:MAG: hypothetical protein ACKVZJ_05870 [Phycisphaerales bacterium]